MGLFGLTIPKEFGGLGLSVQALRLVLTHIGSYHTGLFYLLVHHYTVVNAVLKFGNQDQKEHFLNDMATGTVATTAIFETTDNKEIAKIQTTLTSDGDGYLLNGVKSRIPRCQRTGYVLLVAKEASTRQPKIILVPLNKNVQHLQEVGKRNYSGLMPLEHIELSFINLPVTASQILGLQIDAKCSLNRYLRSGNFKSPLAQQGYQKPFWNAPVMKHPLKKCGDAIWGITNFTPTELQKLPDTLLQSMPWRS